MRKRSRALTLAEMLVTAGVFGMFLLVLVGLDLFLFRHQSVQAARQDLSLRVLQALDKIQMTLDGALVDQVEETSVRFRSIRLSGAGHPLLLPGAVIAYEKPARLFLAEDGFVTVDGRKLALLGRGTVKFTREAPLLDNLLVEVEAQEGDRRWSSSRTLVLRNQR